MAPQMVDVPDLLYDSASDPYDLHDHPPFTSYSFTSPTSSPSRSLTLPGTCKVAPSSAPPRGHPAYSVADTLAFLQSYMVDTVDEVSARIASGEISLGWIGKRDLDEQHLELAREHKRRRISGDGSTGNQERSAATVQMGRSALSPVGMYDEPNPATGEPRRTGSGAAAPKCCIHDTMDGEVGDGETGVKKTWQETDQPGSGEGLHCDETRAETDVFLVNIEHSSADWVIARRPLQDQ
jgi:hypothetical protein